MSLNDNRYHVKNGLHTEQYLSSNLKHSVNSLLLNLPSLRYCTQNIEGYIYKPNFEGGE